MVYYSPNSTGTYISWTNNSTGTCDPINSTTTTCGDYDNWNYFSTAGTISPFGQSYTFQYCPRPIEIPIIARLPSEQELLKQHITDTKAAEAAKKAKEETDIAAKKARELLSEYLCDENRKRLLDKKPLEISSRLFDDVKYQIPIQYGRIKALKNGKIITELCISVKEHEPLPVEDVLLTKLLHVMHDEENMLRTANHYNKQENLLARLN